jgi:hypothetical protein
MSLPYKYQILTKCVSFGVDLHHIKATSGLKKENTKEMNLK